MPRLAELFKNEITGRLQKQFGYSNIMQVPRVQKVVVNIGVGEAKVDYKFMETSLAELRTITGQQPMMKRAKRSVA
ncbi:MAG: 50S ribosomal protein L5, partial [Thermovirgaceae bacterium]|nr:50S ribosomal protein L5 [Thermovirgaceae bacterium]